jgi:methyl-accepting chemotaxis protein
MGAITLDTDQASAVADGTDARAHTANRIADITSICERAARGDLEARITGMYGDPAWEPLALAINRMLDIADSFVREAAAAMEHCSHDEFHRPILLRGLKGAYRQSAAVINHAGLKMKESSDQIRYIAHLATETASNVTTVAAACEELTGSTSEISTQAEGSAKLTQEAVSVARKATEAVGELNTAAKKVDKIVTLITTIAEAVGRINDGADAISHSASQQVQATSEITRSINEVSQNTSLISKRIGSVGGPGKGGV